jgi:hypothetical protein
MNLHYLSCKIGEHIESLSALQAEVRHAEKLEDEQKPPAGIGGKPCSCQVAPTSYVNMITLTVDVDCPYHGQWHGHSART